MKAIKKESRGKARNENTVRKIKHAFNGLICILNIAKERISELENRSIETSQTKM